MKKYKVYVNGQPYEVVVEEMNEQKTFSTAPADTKIQQTVTPPEAQKAPAPQTATATKPSPIEKPQSKSGEGFPVVAPMPGSIIDIKVNIGDNVNEGDVLILLEAMKMENEVTAPASGVVKSIAVQKGASVNTGDIMVVIE
ncbi:MAG: biotin/lipoyl-containing protein [Dethiobacteria bacterium]|jgi:biotin carboxyl carrier protein